MGWIQIAGSPSATFAISSNQGNTIEVCVQNDVTGQLLGSGCQSFTVTGADLSVDTAAG